MAEEGLQRASTFDFPTRTSLPSGGPTSYIAGTADGKVPWGWRWLGVPLLLCACMVTGAAAWGSMEDHLDTQAFAHLTCEGVDTSELSLDWSYRDVTVDGRLPAGVTAERVQEILGDGSSNAACLDEEFGINADDDPGIYNVDVQAIAGTAAATSTLVDPTDDDPATAPTVAPTPAATAAPTPQEEPAAEPDESDESDQADEPEPVAAALSATAAFDGEQIRLVGEVGDDSQRQALVDAARRAVGADNVTDELVVVDGEPTASSEARIDELVGVISRFDGQGIVEGTASVDDAELSFALVASTENAVVPSDLPGRGTVDVQAADPAAADTAASDENDDTEDADDSGANTSSSTADEPAADVTFTG